jgi:hypothetical protein
MTINRQYIDELWFTIHHSDDPERQTLIIRCYLDESGTDAGSPEAIIGGLLINRYDFLMFDAVWSELMKRHNIQPPLHMKEFGEHGRHGHLNYPQREALFSEISGLINCYKKMSIATTISHKQYKTLLHPALQKKMSLYGLCFMLCAHLIHLGADNIPYNIPYIVEQGNEYQQHILEAHAGMIRMQKENIPLHVGSLTFEDKSLSALQAADVIAWGNRRIVTGIPIDKGFEPILEIFREPHHANYLWKDSYIKELSDGLMKCS